MLVRCKACQWSPGCSRVYTVDWIFSNTVAYYTTRFMPTPSVLFANLNPTEHTKALRHYKLPLYIHHLRHSTQIHSVLIQLSLQTVRPETRCSAPRDAPHRCGFTPPKDSVNFLSGRRSPAVIPSIVDATTSMEAVQLSIMEPNQVLQLPIWMTTYRDRLPFGSKAKSIFTVLGQSIMRTTNSVYKYSLATIWEALALESRQIPLRLGSWKYGTMRRSASLIHGQLLRQYL